MITALMEKYSDLFTLANQIGLKNPDAQEDAAKLPIEWQTEYQLDANRLWPTSRRTPGGRTRSAPIFKRSTRMYSASYRRRR